MADSTSPDTASTSDKPSAESEPKSLAKQEEELKKLVGKLTRDLEFWKQQFKKQLPTKKCTKCRQPIDVWPFNFKEGYYIKGNRVTHTTCPPTTKENKTNEE